MVKGIKYEFNIYLRGFKTSDSSSLFFGMRIGYGLLLHTMNAVSDAGKK
jgi:hypothetical protein